MRQSGKVWLAGAGPGDAGLLTVKTRTLIDQVDVVVYDALISAEILSLIPVETRKINVGKRASHHLVPQEEINKILLELAMQGNKVLRLKGGDPFVFGRGGEELELLVKEGIPFEIVPGITSAVAVAAYAGIPITHRDYTSSFHVITGHPRKGKESTTHYEALVHMDATLVFLMGVSSMETICSGLIAAGMDINTPAAVLEKGTTAKQRNLISTVGELVADAKKANVQTPAIIMVGKVCGLSESFQWTQHRLLHGKQVLITRPKQLISSLANKLRELGAQVIELPAIITEEIIPNPVLKNALLELRNLKKAWFVFTSPTGVDIFFHQLLEMKYDMRQMFINSDVKIAVIGSATNKALEKHGLFADIMPKVYCAQQLGEVLAKEIGNTVAEDKSRVMIFRAQEGSKELAPPLENLGISYVDIALYKTICKADGELKEKIVQMIDQQEIDWVTFTSASTVKGFVATFGDMDYSVVHAICIGEQTAAEARKYGMKISVSTEATVDSMIQCMSMQK